MERFHDPLLRLYWFGRRRQIAPTAHKTTTFESQYWWFSFPTASPFTHDADWLSDSDGTLFVQGTHRMPFVAWSHPINSAALLAWIRRDPLSCLRIWSTFFPRVRTPCGRLGKDTGTQPNKTQRQQNQKEKKNQQATTRFHQSWQCFDCTKARQVGKKWLTKNLNSLRKCQVHLGVEILSVRPKRLVEVNLMCMEVTASQIHLCPLCRSTSGELAKKCLLERSMPEIQCGVWRRHGNQCVNLPRQSLDPPVKR